MLSIHERSVRGLDLVLWVYAVGLLVLGTLVWGWNWMHLGLRTGHHANKILLGCLLIFLCLSEGGEHKVEYICSLCPALLGVDVLALPTSGCCFTEESCEASLSCYARPARGTHNKCQPRRSTNCGC